MATLTKSENSLLQKLVKKLTSEKPEKIKKETLIQAAIRKLDYPIFK